MTKDQIRELLLELGAPKGRVQDCVLIPEDVLERFAAAIRSATKEEDARMCNESADSHQGFKNYQAVVALDYMADAIRASK